MIVHVGKQCDGQENHNEEQRQATSKSQAASIRIDKKWLVPRMQVTTLPTPGRARLLCTVPLCSEHFRVLPHHLSVISHQSLRYSAVQPIFNSIFNLKSIASAGHDSNRGLSGSQGGRYNTHVTSLLQVTIK